VVGRWGRGRPGGPIEVDYGRAWRIYTLNRKRVSRGLRGRKALLDGGMPCRCDMWASRLEAGFRTGCVMAVYRLTAT